MIGTDATHRALAEEALRVNEARFRALFDNSLDAIFFTRPDGSIEAANPAACAMYGFSDDEFRALRRSDVLDVDDPRLAATLEERKRTGRVGARQLTGVRKTGERFPIEADSVIMPGDPVRAFVLSRDITERKRIEEALRDSEERFRSLFESAAEGVALHELVYDGDRAVDYRLLEVNPSFERQTGLAVADARGVTFPTSLDPAPMMPSSLSESHTA